MGEREVIFKNFCTRWEGGSSRVLNFMSLGCILKAMTKKSSTFEETNDNVKIPVTFTSFKNPAILVFVEE